MGAILLSIKNLAQSQEDEHIKGSYLCCVVGVVIQLYSLPELVHALSILVVPVHKLTTVNVVCPIHWVSADRVHKWLAYFEQPL